METTHSFGAEYAEQLAQNAQYRKAQRSDERRHSATKNG